MRNFIRTSHDQRRRSSAAATADQVAYMAALSEQRQSFSAVDNVKLAADIRRSSMGEGACVKGPVGQLAAVSSGVQDRRRGSLTGGVAGAVAVAQLGATSGGVFQSSPRRRWNGGKTRVPLNKIDTFNMEIKQTSVLATVFIVCMACVAVVLLAYGLKACL